MKYLLIIFSILLIFLSINFIRNSDHKELYTIAKVIENNNYKIKEWSIYSRKPIGEVKNEKEFYKEANKIKMEKEDYEWTSIEDVDHHIKIVGVYENTQYLNRIIITAVKYNESYNLEVANEVKGYQWNPKDINTILAKNDFPSDGASTFYSINGEANMDIIGEGELAQKAKEVMDDLTAFEVEKLTDDDFVALSGLSTKWENKIALNVNKEMNLQIAMRFHPQDKKINVTVGIPIIITEY